MEQLNRHIHPCQTRPVKILQFGEGNFLRAFIDWFIQRINEETNFNGNVAVVQPLASGRVKELAEQDGCYTVLLEGVSNGTEVHEKCIIDCLSEFVDPYKDYETYLSYGEQEELQIIVSNTTEAGISYDPSDIQDQIVSPTYPGKLLSLLKHRYDHFHGDNDKGLYILPCELIDHNGTTLKQILNQLAQDRGYDSTFITWLNEANTFYNTLVDRIVPGYPKDQIAELEKENHYIDHNIVKGEIFHLWVIEGDPAIKKVLPFDQTDLNIIVTDHVMPYKERKVKILNGAHTCMVPIAYQYGKQAVNEMMQDSVMTKFLSDFLKTEVCPTIDLPQAELEQFTQDVMERFQNPTIYHELLTISLNSMTKYKTRILPSAISYYEKTGKLPRHALFSLASLFAMYRLKKEDGSSLIVDDPEFVSLWDRLWNTSNIPALVNEVMSLPHWEYDFRQMDGAISYVTECLNDIIQNGMKTALETQFG